MNTKLHSNKLFCDQLSYRFYIYPSYSHECLWWWHVCCVATRWPQQRHSNKQQTVANQLIDFLFVCDSLLGRICQVMPCWILRWILCPLLCRLKQNTSSSEEEKNLGEKKVPWTVRGKPKILWPAQTDIRHGTALQWGLFCKGMDYCNAPLWLGLDGWPSPQGSNKTRPR